MSQFELATVIIVLAVFSLFGFGAYKAEKALAVQAKEASVENHAKKTVTKK